MKVYVDINVIYYVLTANDEFGPRAKELIEGYYGRMITSALTVWQLYILLRRSGAKLRISQVLEDLGVKVVALTPEIIKIAEECKKLDFDDSIHYATMKAHGINVILSNDKDFDRVEDVKRLF
ncbi:type II toxin-antitoxin system VapC family toxin [Thermococcus sp. Bubb.Bath]|uniref:type II toxin-antitoxin system VapC family toxin n=1 Tax=Thermococcus sp. Bubb.Bath TaxID=1638242 RepID=UPI00143ACBF7|nr:type II toxin-antitoxin system VapC family toxin [Thermococcus sp. Bubb.Bath]NJF25698.1 type II toxin-antitoxin system VapC family toxin [Thermococcus sp. Bubb.Bath]